ncbi:MAG: hypothetical protein QM655_11885 [Nocardioidaceae bacterium]
MPELMVDETIPTGRVVLAWGVAVGQELAHHGGGADLTDRAAVDELGGGQLEDRGVLLDLLDEPGDGRLGRAQQRSDPRLGCLGLHRLVDQPQLG